MFGEVLLCLLLLLFGLRLITLEGVLLFLSDSYGLKDTGRELT